MSKLTAAEIATALDDLPEWQHGDGSIQRTFDRGDFVGSVEFVNLITPMAEHANHHPDVAISWKDVTITLTTHSEGGLTSGDFDLAHKIDLIA